MARDSTEKELTPKQQGLLEALLKGYSVPDAARELNIPRRTAYSWVRRPEFEAELRRGMRESLDQVLRALTRSGLQAVSVLRRNMGHDVSAGTQVRAAIAILEQTVKLGEHYGIEQRLLALEEALAAQGDNQHRRNRT